MQKKLMLAGFARKTINPPLGTSMEGLGVGQPSESIHDDLFVRVLFLSQGDSELYLVNFDLLFFDRRSIDRFKGAMGRVLDVKPSQIFINFTHTHAGPRVSWWAYSDGPDDAYMDRVERVTIETARAAREQACKVSLRAGETETDVPVSRRKINGDGKADWAPYPDGVVYEKLPFCFLTDEAGAVVSVLFSVACHPSMTYKPVISAEFPGAAMRVLNEHFHTEGSMFLQGAAGDAKPRSGAVEDKRWKDCSWEEIEATGQLIAGLIVQASKNTSAVEPDLQYELREADWLLQEPFSREQYEAFAEKAERAEKRTWARDMLHRLEDAGSLPRVAPISVHFVQLGRGLRLIGVEGEVLARLGVRLREIYDRGVTFVLGYSNGTQIYMPVTEELPEEGYEVVSYWEYHWPAGCAEGCEEPLLDLVRERSVAGVAPNT